MAPSDKGKAPEVGDDGDAEVAKQPVLGGRRIRI